MLRLIYYPIKLLFVILCYTLVFVVFILTFNMKIMKRGISDINTIYKPGEKGEALENVNILHWLVDYKGLYTWRDPLADDDDNSY